VRVTAHREGAPTDWSVNECGAYPSVADMSVVENPRPITPASNSSRGSYPSRQKRFGPAPLASFEDLPTDEQSSSEDERARPERMACPQISFLITDHNDCESQQKIVEESFSDTSDHNWLASPQVKGMLGCCDISQRS